MIKNSNLKPIIKWAGGKEKELQYIISNLPDNFENYYEPFVGGGSVFLSVAAKKHFINDLSKELIYLYISISEHNAKFFNFVNTINDAWHFSKSIFLNNIHLIDLYKGYRENNLNDHEIKALINEFCKRCLPLISDCIGPDLSKYISLVHSELNRNICQKIMRMKVIELSKHLMPDSDISDNIEGAIKSAFYMFFRSLYNDRNIQETAPDLHCALFYFIRNFCYSGMFRYNSKGEFNVPYGGIAYNSKSMDKQIEYYNSDKLADYFHHTHIFNLDFEDFLNKTKPTASDFVFLDPPYDSEFSTYAQNEFNQDDQKRLANYMINSCMAKWMLIIKDTELIRELYDNKGLNIKSFNKEYKVSFMNRNNRHTTHLLITNY